METLTREECFDLARKARAGDRAAEQRLIVCHLPLARIEASRFHSFAGPDMGAEDIRGHAELILVEQTRRYDPERGVPYRAWVAIQLRARLWNLVRPDRALGRARFVGASELDEDTTEGTMDGEAGVRALVGELEKDPEMRLALGLVVSGLDAVEAQRRGVQPKRYAELRAKLRARLSEGG